MVGYHEGPLAEVTEEPPRRSRMRRCPLSLTGRTGGRHRARRRISSRSFPQRRSDESPITHHFFRKGTAHGMVPATTAIPTSRSGRIFGTQFPIRGGGARIEASGKFRLCGIAVAACYFSSMGRGCSIPTLLPSVSINMIKSPMPGMTAGSPINSPPDSLTKRIC